MDIETYSKYLNVWNVYINILVNQNLASFIQSILHLVSSSKHHKSQSVLSEAKQCFRFEEVDNLIVASS